MAELYSCFCERYLVCWCATLHQAISEGFVLSLFWTSAQHTPLCFAFIVCPLSHMAFKTHTHMRADTNTSKWPLLLIQFLFFGFSLPTPPSPPNSRAVVEKYLLEKSRLVSREKNERWGRTAGVLTHHCCWTFLGPPVQTCGVSNVWIWSLSDGFRLHLLTLYVFIYKEPVWRLNGCCYMCELSPYTILLYYIILVNTF